MTPPTTTAPLLQVNGLCTDLLTPAGAKRVVDGLSFDVHAGEVCAIVGESGSGKSLAMLSLLGLLPQPPARVTGGQAWFEGEDLLQATPQRLRQLRGRRIGMVFQEPMSALNPVLPVGEQIAETLRTHLPIGRADALREAVRLMDRVRIADAPQRARQYPHELSGGMRQRVVIAAAIACKPALIVADEPTTALDATVQAEVLALLDELRREVGCAIVLITHDMAVVRAVADTVHVVLAGRCIEAGPRDAVLQRPQHASTRALIAASTVATHGQAALPAATPGLVALRNLVVSFPLRRRWPFGAPDERLFAVDGVSLHLAAGETLALVGESGSGKTTVARALLGLVGVEAGEITLDGRGVSIAELRRARVVQTVFQDPQASLDPRFVVWRCVTEPLWLAGEHHPTALRDTAARLLNDVGMGPAFLDRYPHQLSGGQRQRLGIARALATSPRLLIADEAVAALDAATRLQVIELLQQLQQRHGLAMLFITHDLSVVARIAHRVAVMRFGRILETGPTERVLERPQHAYTRRLIAAMPGARPRGEGGEASDTCVDAGPARHRHGRAGSQAAALRLEEVAPGHLIAVA
jgi:peptide/nickel transport system ATP-binding protein